MVKLLCCVVMVGFCLCLIACRLCYFDWSGVVLLVFAFVFGFVCFAVLNCLCLFMLLCDFTYGIDCC